MVLPLHCYADSVSLNAGIRFNGVKQKVILSSRGADSAQMWRNSSESADCAYSKIQQKTRERASGAIADIINSHDLMSCLENKIRLHLYDLKLPSSLRRWVIIII